MLILRSMVYYRACIYSELLDKRPLLISWMVITKIVQAVYGLGAE
jgi:hypothetical protein